MRLFINIIIIVLFLNSCFGPKAVSTIESYNFDEKNNQTVFNKFPFGSVSMPGKWTKVSYNDVSTQHNFRNTDSVLTAVAINKTSSYPFYKTGMTSNTFVEEMYEWDSKYLVEQIKGKRTIIKQDTSNHFIIWQITTDTLNLKIDNHYLFGCENGIIFTVFISTEKWANEQKVNFVEMVYKNKTVGVCCD
ncbi:MAG: hypothetical protein ACHQNT_09885 [Bacteroidia bacterium]